MEEIVGKLEICINTLLSVSVTGMDPKQTDVERIFLIVLSWTVSHQNSHQLPVPRDHCALKKVTEWKSFEWPLIQCDWCPYQKKRFGHRERERDIRHMYTQEDNSKSSGPEGSHLQTKERNLRRKQICQHLDFSPWNCEKTCFCCLSHSVCGTL